MLRKIAVRIALLSSEDRTWLMRHLSSSDTKKLRALIDEAIEMGLTSDRSVLDNILDDKKVEPLLDDQPFSVTELMQLPLFWQELIETYQKSDLNESRLPTELMASIKNNARQLLSNNSNFSGNK